MRTLDAIARILKIEGIENLSAFPTTSLIESAADIGIKPVICRQERVGVGIADGFARVANGKPPGVFAMQYGPGAENAYAGIATAFSDAVPLLLLPLGHPAGRDGVYPNFSSVRAYESVAKNVERLHAPGLVADAMRRAFALLKMGRPGPVLLEIPADVGEMDVPEGAVESYKPVKAATAGANLADADEAAAALLAARNPVIYAGQGVLYADASDDLVDLAETLQIPVTTSMAGKSAFPEKHPLSLGSASGVMNGAALRFLRRADLVFAIGSSLSKHGMTLTIPSDKTLIQATNDPIDISKSYHVEHPLLGDAKPVIRAMTEACRERLGGAARDGGSATAAEIAQAREAWLSEWTHKLTSDEVPINPYRVMWDFMRVVDSDHAIVTHDSGSPRDQLMPFYRAGGPRTYLGWGKSHGLGTGLGLNIGAKLADPDKFVVNFMGDAAFGMTGLDFETAVRAGLPILTIVLNNSTMAIETSHMARSHELYRTRDLGGEYAGLARAMGGWAEKVEDPADVAPAILRAKAATENGQAALLEFITSEEGEFSHRRPFG